jgi:diaminopimelate decarboxylase
MTFDPRDGWPEVLATGPGDSQPLAVDGCDLSALAGEYGTPLWVVSRSTLEGNFDRLRGALQGRYPNCELAYSIKAHNTLAVIRLLHLRGAKADCSAEHEFQLALGAGLPPEDIILNGNGKSDAALSNAARLGIRQVNVDSFDEIRRLDAIARELGRRVNCCVRVQLSYQRLLSQDPSFESTLRIGEGKFGVNVAGNGALDAVAAVAAADNLDFVGLSHHVGFSGYMGDFTAEHELMHHRECTRELCEFAAAAERQTGVRVERIDLGGGFRAIGRMLLSTPGAGEDVAFHDVPTADDYAEAIFGSLERHVWTDRLPLVQFETGGHSVSDAVMLVARVSEVKDVIAPRRRRYVVLDASMMMFVSRGMMRVGHPVLLVNRPLAEPVSDLPVEVVGQTCVYDSMAEDIRLPEVQAGDLVTLLHQGAYCETQSTQFNAFPRPAVVLADAGQAHLIKRRESLADIQARDLLPEAVEHAA